jgi:hypothetical protein
MAFPSIASALQSPPPKPFIVNITDPATSELTGLRDVLLGSLGLAGVLVIVGILLAVVFAGVMFWIRSRAAGETDVVRLTPDSTYPKSE